MLLSTAYAPPVQYFCKLFSTAIQGQTVWFEAQEHFVKQSYRNRCLILTPGGVMPLSIPLEQDARPKVPITEVRISSHGNWMHLHRQAIVSAYGRTPFFEYYWDEIAPMYSPDAPSTLWAYNRAYLQRLLALMEIDVDWQDTTDYQHEAEGDYRSVIRPRKPLPDPTFRPVPYYQLFDGATAFVPNLSILDLLFNMGPEALLVLRDSNQQL